MYLIWKGRFLSFFVVVELTRVSIVWTSPRTPRSPCCTRRCWRQWRRPALSVWSESWYSHFELIKYTSFPRPVRKSKGRNHLKQTCICTPYLLKRLPRKETQKTISELDWADVVSQTQALIGSGWIEEDVTSQIQSWVTNWLKWGTKTQRTLIFSLSFYL